MCLYKDPKGENIFKNIASTPVRVTKDSERVFTETEVNGLRKRIIELEDAVKEKDVSL